ncbi:slit homolog 2 protein-like [Microplitis demolitor]|uniref:slit homolog 2 protein-like n=1 Tax=Microplitis demolitor TaxID=69319 RepID=UPI0004CCE455|nr:slit homolog 2 protein-like [Microplitis demolitor]XP_053598140.1 slit homolog 2 protein-like [Microplitis demolitor]XP_053598141.1 slit homolog 2 protein-like [Microplitis demolitor]
MATCSNSFPALPIALIITSISITTIKTSSDLCPVICKCEDEFLRASCVYASLEVVPIQLNPEIHHLDLSTNRIATLNLGFGFYDNLESLDLSYNTLHTLGSNNFLLQTHLVMLNISNNNIRTVGRNSLKGLDSLKVLDLNNNNITEADSAAFRHTSELEDLNLSGNSLTSLPNDLFRNLHRIRILKLSRNSLLEVPKSNLHLVPSLEDLELSENLIQEISHDSLPTLRSLVSLNLANNVIRIIKDEAFQRLPALLYLNLQGNNLTYVPTPALSHLSLLSYLILSRNPLEKLDNLAFRNLFELKTIDLRECTIAHVKSRAFADNVNLEKIFLDKNRDLRRLPPRILHSARYLTTISLRHCNLSNLEATHFPVHGLNLLQIGGNPLICNCSLHWLWNVIHDIEERNASTLFIDRGEIICADEKFNGKLLMTLSESSLHCRLSPLYLSLSAAGCLIVTAIIIIIIGYITHAKRRKRLFDRLSRPEILIYVEPTEDVTKCIPMYPSLRIDQNRVPILSSGSLHKFDGNQKRYDNTSYNAPHYDKHMDHNITNFTVEDFPNRSMDNSSFYGKCNKENVYGVTDVTNIQKEPDVYDNSIYRMENSNNRISQARCHKDSNISDYDCVNDYEFYSPSNARLAKKPHVVFV